MHRVVPVALALLVVLAGDPAFVDAAVVNGTSGAVTVTIESQNSS